MMMSLQRSIDNQYVRENIVLSNQNNYPSNEVSTRQHIESRKPT